MTDKREMIPTAFQWLRKYRVWVIIAASAFGIFWCWGNSTSWLIWYALYTEPGPKMAHGVRLSVVRECSFGFASTYWLYVRDPKHNDKPVLIGGPFFSDGKMFGRAIWARDGSFVAMEDAYVDEKRPLYTAAYDVASHALVEAGQGPSSEMSNHAYSQVEEQRSKRIANLLRERGGKGSVTLDHFTSELCVPMTRFQDMKFPR